jgi:hypothetical protein
MVLNIEWLNFLLLDQFFRFLPFLPSHSPAPDTGPNTRRNKRYTNNTNLIIGSQPGIPDPSLPLSYLPAGMISPGTHVGTTIEFVSRGSDGDIVLVSDAAHEIAHAWCTWIPSVNRTRVPWPCESVPVIVVLPGVTVR